MEAVCDYNFENTNFYTELKLYFYKLVNDNTCKFGKSIDLEIVEGAELPSLLKFDYVALRRNIPELTNH